MAQEAEMAQKAERVKEAETVQKAEREVEAETARRVGMRQAVSA